MIIKKTIPDLFSTKGRDTKQLEYKSERLAFYLTDEERNAGRVIVDGYGLVMPHEYSYFAIRDGSTVIVTPEVNEITTAALIAYAIIALKVALVVGAVMGLAWLMAKALTPSYGAKDNGMDNTPTYGWEGIKNTSDVGIPVGIVYGTHLVGGNFINVYTDIDDNESYLYALIGLSEGPVESVAGYTSDTDNLNLDTVGDNILINNNPINNYDGVKAYVRMGSVNQKVIPGFGDIVNQRAMTIKLEKDNAVIIQTEIEDMEAFVVQFSSPGIYKTSNSGMKSTTIKIDVKYRRLGTSEWTFAGQKVMDDVKSTTTVRYQYRVDELTPDAYEIMLIKRSGDSSNKQNTDVNVDALLEIKYDDCRYPYTALLGLKIKATDQLSGGMPKITTIVKGRKINVYNGSSWSNTYSNNPVWCMWDLLTNTRYGLGNYISTGMLDEDKFLQEAQYCDELVDVIDADGESTQEKRYELDIVIDGLVSAIDLLQQIGTTFHCTPIWSNGAIYPVIERPWTESTYAQIFGMGSIKKETFVESFASYKDAYNVVEVQFNDKNNNYNRDSVVVEDVNIDNVRKKTIHLPGITRRTQAQRLGKGLILDGKMNIRSVTFTSATSAVTARVGQVIGIAHDVPGWSLGSSRCRDGSNTNSIVLNSSITIPSLPSGQTCSIMVKHSGTDVCETKVVANSPGIYNPGDRIVIVGSWSTVPSRYDEYIIGVTNLVVKPFRLMSVKRGADGEVQLSAREYNAEAFNLNNAYGKAKDYSYLPDPRKKPLPVTNLTAVNSSSYNRTIYISWAIPKVDLRQNAISASFEVQYSSDNGKTWVKLGSTTKSNYEFHNSAVGTTYKIRVWSVNGFNIRSTTAPVISILSLIGIPPTIKGLEIKGQGNNTVFKTPHVTLSWKEVSLPTSIYPAGQEAYGAGSGARDTYFDHYRVEVYTPSVHINDVDLLRGIYNIHDHQFRYLMADNIADHQKLRDKWWVPQGYTSRTITFKIYTIDVFGGKSLPATITVTNTQEKWLRVTESDAVGPTTPMKEAYCNYINGNTANVSINFHPLYSFDANGTLVNQDSSSHPWHGKPLVDDPDDLKEYRLYICGPFNTYQDALDHGYTHGTGLSAPLMLDARRVYSGQVPNCTINLDKEKYYLLWMTSVDVFSNEGTLDLTFNTEDGAVVYIPSTPGLC